MSQGRRKMTQQEFDSIRAYRKIQVMDGQKKKYRAMKEDGDTVFIFAPSSRKYGHRITRNRFMLEYKLLTTEKSRKQKWEKDVARVIKYLEASGLWPNVLETYRNLRKLGYDNWQEAKALYDKASVLRWEQKAEVDYKALYGDLYTRFPFLLNTDMEGRIYPATDYLWELSDPKVKSMYFGKFWNSEYKAKIKSALSSGEKIDLDARAGYDVSYSYEPEKKKAYYREEYRGCGNGHYYLALDADHALFCEDD